VDTASPDLIDTAAAGPAAMRGGILRIGAFAGSLILALAAAPLLVRHLGDVEFGRYSTALAVVAIVAGLTEGGVATVALRELSVAMRPADRSRLMSDLLGLRLVLSTTGVGVAVAFTAVAGYGAELTLGVFLAGIGMVLTTTQSLLVVDLQSRLRFGWAALIELARGVVGIVLIVVLVLSGKGTVALLAVAVPAGLASLALTVPLVRGTLSLRPAFAPRRWVPLIREVMVIALSVAIYALYFRITLLITSLTSTAEQTGYFSISFRLMEALVGIPALLIGAAFPIISRSALDDRERFEYATKRIYELGLFLGGLMALGLMLSAPFAIQVLVGTSRHPSVEVLQIQSAALVAGFVVAATSFPLLAMRRYRELLIATSTSLLLTAALALALAPSIGADGAAIAAVTGDFVLAGTLTLLLMRRDGPPLPLSAVAVTLSAGALGYAAGRLVGVHPLIEAVSGGIVFLVVLGAMRRFPPELREVLDLRRAGR
jgi:O-antigen/teichoic acid export membrane protein